MFDIGFTELTLLAVIGLLVLGPERLPAVARVVGGYLRKARRTWATVRAEIEAELSAEEIRRSVGKPLEELEALRESARQRIDLGGARAAPDPPQKDPAADAPAPPDPPESDDGDTDGDGAGTPK